jgi:hypothetical protein
VTLTSTRTLAAIALALCIALPMATCTRYVDAAGEAVDVPEGTAPPPGTTKIVDYQIPGEQLWTNPLGGILIALTFLWPAATLVHARLGRSARVKRALWWSQPLLLAAAAWYAWNLSHLGDPAFGAYVAAGAIAVLALVWLAELGAGERGEGATLVAGAGSEPGSGSPPGAGGATGPTDTMLGRGQSDRLR